MDRLLLCASCIKQCLFCASCSPFGFCVLKHLSHLFRFPMPLSFSLQLPASPFPLHCPFSCPFHFALFISPFSFRPTVDSIPFSSLPPPSFPPYFHSIPFISPFSISAFRMQLPFQAIYRLTVLICIADAKWPATPGRSRLRAGKRRGWRR